MKKQTRRVSRSGLLLTETLLAILFFSIASAICLQLFVKTHNISRRTQALELAVMQANSVAQLIQSVSDSESLYDSVLSEIRYVYPKAVGENQQIRLYYDRDGQNCNEKDAAYVLNISSPNDWTTTNGEYFFPNICSIQMCDLSYDSGSEEYECYFIELETYYNNGKGAAG